MSEQNVPVKPPRRRGPLIAAVIAAVVVVAVIVTIVVVTVANSNSTAAKGSAGNPVKIGVVGASDPQWDAYKDAAAAAGISIELVDFTDYAQPNPALTAGDLDLNEFQHIIYLAQYNTSAGEDLVPIGSTATFPLGLYSKKYDSVDAIPDGSTVALPNDSSNLARGLLVLQSAGLIELKDGGSPFSTVDDVLDTSRVKVTTLDANLTPTSLDDVAAAIINNDYVADAGLTADDAIAQDDPNDPSAKPYINIFAARSEDADNALYLQLVQIFQDTPAVTDALVETSGDTAVLVKDSAADLQATLDEVEAEITG